jgi:Ca2+-binding RTX toxin-like protein
MAILNGTEGADNFSGTAEDDIINGLGGNDRLIGMQGNDVVNGDAGDDELHGSWGNDTLNGGDGFDIISYLNSDAAVTINLGTGGAAGGFADGDQFSGVEGVSGSQLNDALWGDAAANTLLGIEGDDRLIGMAGDDVIDGGAGNDELHGSWGADTLNGGDGIDLIAYLNSDAGVTVNLTTGEAAGGFAAGDQWTGIEGVSGSQLNDLLIGDALANTLIGLEGGDTINGAAGNDTINADAGNDAMNGGAGGDAIDGGAGIDTADYNGSGSAVTVNLATNANTGGYAEGDTLTNVENLQGSVFGDTLTGDGANNILSGLNGNDVLDGGAGWDTLEGGNGDDQLAGGAGGDILRGGAGADHLAGGADYDIASYWDSAVGVTINLQTQVNTGGTAEGDTIANDVETINGSNHDDVMTGNTLGNALIGFDGDDILNGGGGDDVLRGGSGADTLNGGAGADYFSYTAVSDSTVSAADTIQDFQTWDVISVRMIDADGNAGNGDTAFSFIGTAAYTGVAGQLRYAVTSPGVTTIAGDINGDGTSDFHIRLDGAITLQASDFML